MSVGLRLNPHFLSAWLRHPLQTGALVPSSDRLAVAMAAQVGTGGGLILELGAGTGAVTAALLARGITPCRLLVLEKDPDLVRELVRRFPGLPVVEEDATRIKGVVQQAGAQQVDAVVSSLPLLSMRGLTRTRVLAQAFALLRPNAPLVQFTYSPLPPIPPALTAALGITGERVARVLRNFPPANVWVYRRLRPT